MFEEYLIPILLVAAVTIVLFFTGKKKSTKKVSSSDLTTDLLAKARAGELDPVDGRDEEIERMIHVIARRTKNNPLLIGQPGVGKTALVDGLALRIVKGDVPDALKQKRILALDITSLMSETKYRGELESRLQALLKELESMKGNGILFIDEFHMLEQVRGAEGSVGITEAIKPALARGEIQVIGATTWDEYERYIHPNQALDRRMQIVLVDEPSKEESLKILKKLRPIYEEFHGVKIDDDALKAAVELSDKAIEERYLPDKAIDVMDEAAAKVSLETHHTSVRATLGAVHSAAKSAQGEHVGKDDVQNVVEQWISHANARKTYR